MLYHTQRYLYVVCLCVCLWIMYMHESRMQSMMFLVFRVDLKKQKLCTCMYVSCHVRAHLCLFAWNSWIKYLSVCPNKNMRIDMETKGWTSLAMVLYPLVYTLSKWQHYTMYLKHIEEAERKWVDKFPWFCVEMSSNYIKNNEIVIKRCMGSLLNEEYVPCDLEQWVCCSHGTLWLSLHPSHPMFENKIKWV